LGNRRADGGARADGIDLHVNDIEGWQGASWVRGRAPVAMPGVHATESTWSSGVPFADAVSRRPNGSDPIDRRLLAAQTGGDRQLERDVLTLFLAKADADLARIRAAATPGARREAAHALVGSARAIGAADVARFAAAVEAAPEHPAEAVGDLATAIAAAQGFIRRLIDPAGG
jgi:HPt (histidine-containing phosphotransfer) domain-containing protein